jgi:hypothetical protein
MFVYFFYAFLNRSSDCDETLGNGWTHARECLNLNSVNGKAKRDRVWLYLISIYCNTL